MASALKAAVAVLAVLLLGLALNPGPESHREKLKQEIAARSQIAALLHIGNLAALASTYHTLGLASYTTINDRVVSYGAFGVVVIPDLAGAAGR